jgi:tungstate transport system substrate-binding protein
MFMRDPGIWLIASLTAAAITGCGGQPGGLRLATTTSVDNSGLLEAILPSFHRKTAVDVQVLAVGSGRALQLLRRGDADVALTHDPVAETAFLEDVRGAHYSKIMFNDFVIVGSAEDRASVAAATTAIDAMRRIAGSGAPFISRGDESGTHAREQQLWRDAATKPPADRLLESGQGMAATLRIAHERGAYTLSDRATFLQLSPTIALRVHFEGDPALLNTYAVIVLPRSPRRDDALRFVDWIADGEGRPLIAAFTVGGAHPFTVWPADRTRDVPDAVPR